jgi:hypothetical protein
LVPPRVVPLSPAKRLGLRVARLVRGALLKAGPRVRIRLPPPASPVRTGTLSFLDIVRIAGSLNIGSRRSVSASLPSSYPAAIISMRNRMICAKRCTTFFRRPRVVETSGQPIGRTSTDRPRHSDSRSEDSYPRPTRDAPTPAQRPSRKLECDGRDRPPKRCIVGRITLELGTLLSPRRTPDVWPEFRERRAVRQAPPNLRRESIGPRSPHSAAAGSVSRDSDARASDRIVGGSS